MKRIASAMAVACATACAAPAFATDAGVSDSFDWNGGYAGFTVGYGRGDSTLVFDVIDYTVPYDPDGFIGGVHAGYNQVFSGGFVLGVEADIQLSGMGSSEVLGISNGVPGGVHRYFSDQKWNASIRARLGFASGRFLPFVTGGLAVARYTHGETVDRPFSASANYRGWTAGGGLEYAATDTIVLRAEYRYADYGDQRFEVPNWFDHVVDLTSHDVRLGLSYKF